MKKKYICIYVCVYVSSHIHVYALENNNRKGRKSKTHTRLHIIVVYRGTCPMIIYVSDVPICISLVPGGDKNDNTHNLITIIIISICFYLIVVSLFVTFCDIHCNSLAESVSCIILHSLQTNSSSDFGAYRIFRIQGVSRAFFLNKSVYFNKNIVSF